VRCLATALDFDCAFISEFAGVRTRVRMLAFWNDGKACEPVEYDLKDTPCEAVLDGEVGFYGRDVADLFPRDAWIRQQGHQSFLAIPILSSGGEVLGHLAAFNRKPIDNPVRELSVFRIFGARAGAELERRDLDEALARNEQRLAAMLDQATDAILTIDDEHRVRSFNLAAERMFRCAADWAMSQPFVRFVSKTQRGAIGQYLERAREGTQVWVPDGFEAQRADGEAFPIEFTISPLDVDGAQHYTIILRDISERAKAEKALRNLQSKHESLQETLRRDRQINGLIGDAPAMQRIAADLRKVAETDASVLIGGETGAGKELIARAVHEASARREQPLVTINCAALPGELIESELFGHEKGAFTGAVNLRRGRFELANGGSIFLDEVGELTAQAQAKLLRVLQERSFERVGGTQPIKVDVRVIAATNRDLLAMVENGSFRADLYYRLSVFPLTVPPLRERRSDIPLLVQFFVEKYARQFGRAIEGVEPESMERLLRYRWPGNVRELQNVIERAAILASGPLLKIAESQLVPAELDQDGPANASIEDVSRSHILRVLDECNWIVEGPKGAAAILDLKPSTLRYRMKLLGIEKSRR
jgi:PAS domain S-box-containing protein